MKNLLAPCFAVALASALVHAGPTDDVAAAARTLRAAPNYSWTRTTEIANSQFPSMPVEGRTEQGGFTVVTVTINGNPFQTVSKGEQSVSQGQDGTWVTAEERRAQFAARASGGDAAARGGTGAGGRSRGGFGFFGSGTQQNPADEVSALAAKIKDAKRVDGAVVGTLSASDVAPLLTFGGRGGRGGQTPPAPKNASGTVTFWLKDGALTKYVVNAKGTVSTPNGEERDVERTTTTELENVGTTKVNVPDEAKKKLGA